MAADPQRVYKLVSDLPRMGEWSPENTGGRWLGGAEEAAVGVRFHGTNRKGLRRWSTVSTVVDADPGRRFRFQVDVAALPISEWTYEIEPADGGCRVTERWADRRVPGTRRLTDAFLGVRDRGVHNLAGIRTTLARVKAAAEAG